jgi:hypothetical protein
MILKFFLCVRNFVRRVFTPSNVIKILVIFVIGFVSRLLVNGFFNLNVFYDFLHPISLLYYTCMSCFIVIVHEYFNFSSLPSFSYLFNRLNEFLSNGFSSFAKLSVSDFTLDNIKLSIKNIISRLYNRDKMFLDSESSHLNGNSEMESKIVTPNDKENLILNKKDGVKSEGDSKSSKVSRNRSFRTPQSSSTNSESVDNSPNRSVRRTHRSNSLRDSYKSGNDSYTEM